MQDLELIGALQVSASGTVPCRCKELHHRMHLEGSKKKEGGRQKEEGRTNEGNRKCPTQASNAELQAQLKTANVPAWMKKEDG